MGHNVADLLRLMLVTDDRLLAGKDAVELCRAAERGGATSVQVRLKDTAPRELAQLVNVLLEALTIPVLVNDRADVALACGAAGVHLGPDDVPVSLIRSVAPAGFLIGASVGTFDEVESGRGADYWGVGPWAATGTKADAGTALGPEGFAELVRRGEGRPCVAIGGVQPEDVPLVHQAGGVGVAVVSGILGAHDVEYAAAAYARNRPPSAGSEGA